MVDNRAVAREPTRPGAEIGNSGPGAGRGVAVDDEQGPWWTRPPEPGSQAPQVQRRRSSGPHDVDVEYPNEQTVAVPAPTEYFRPRLVEPPAEPEPEPEPAPEPEPPTPPKPVVRRVAVVPPAPPPVRTVGRDLRDDRTETLPAVGDDIFATFSGPLPTDTNGSGRVGSGRVGSGDPQPTGRSRAGDPLDESPSGRAPGLPGLLAQVKQVNLPEPRVLLLGAAAALVALLIVIVALVSGRGTKTDPPAKAPSAAPSPASAASALQGKDPAGLKQVSAVDAAAQLRRAGQGQGGSIVEAWGWTDKNGRNLVVESVAVAGANKRTLRVIHVAGLDTDPRVLRVMKDPNLPAGCRGRGVASFTTGALVVKDLDGNDVAEVISGWTSRCGSAAAESQIKLALITNGDKYILRGQGVVGQPGAPFTPAPRPARWPDGYLKALTGMYRDLYS